eukprot:PhF_6_TR11321/c1_g1_i1/m.18277
MSTPTSGAQIARNVLSIVLFAFHSDVEIATITALVHYQGVATVKKMAKYLRIPSYEGSTRIPYYAIQQSLDNLQHICVEPLKETEKETNEVLWAMNYRKLFEVTEARLNVMRRMGKSEKRGREEEGEDEEEHEDRRENAFR